MYQLTKPTDEQIRRVIASQARLDFTYPSIGATNNGDHPVGFLVDHNRIRLGSGQATFDAARQALIEWRHYRFDWIDLHRPAEEPQTGQTVGVLARALGIWVLNVCRLVYVVREDLPLRRFAFAYGTLPEHAESGEERFQVEWRSEDDSVWYDLFAFSRPNQWLSRFAYPYMRHKQRQFGRESKLAMKTAVDRARKSGP